MTSDGERRRSFDGERYAARVAALAASGRDMHGEARLCAALVRPGARILDAGCGTGRVAARLAELGYAVTGLDVDESMLAVARRIPGIRWVCADLTTFDLAGPGFDLVVAAGNVFPYLRPGGGPAATARLGAHLVQGGLLVSGFGLAGAQLPADAEAVAIDSYDEWCRRAGLDIVARYATWDGDAWSPGASYAVSVHQRRADSGPGGLR